jgi:pyruvate,orthophosphate dikinase
MGRPCVSGAGGLKIDYAKQQLTAFGRVVKKGEVITLDGSTGQVMEGRVATINPELSGDFGTLMGWADGFRRMQVRANAETPTDARHARDFGAEGIGLCRTEHMFFDEKRVSVVRQMILSDTKAGREVALAKLLPFQRGDFVELFRIMAGLPVTIRLLDPPLHEFLPQEHEVPAVALATGIDAAKI